MLLVALCLISSCAESGRQVTRKDLGDRWPLSVDRGHVDCDLGTFFGYDSTNYALIMIALGKGHQGVEPIWKNAAGSPRNHNPLKVDLTPLIDLA